MKIHDEVINKNGWKQPYHVQEGERWAAYKDIIIVVHPERNPKIINPDGSIQEVTLGQRH